MTRDPETSGNLARRKAGSLRCAIYTRKSSEEGLEQDFNSLQAQREACEAYIASQRHEGWKALRSGYDDGGYSGGTLQRPALQVLLADVHARRIDVVVVYKVDRLTRSLSDFARIVEIFDAAGVSFVSVTQQFNTTSSMGRLTLNVLLSFAQFEREVTGERIRDKIAASKKKGLWMGGHIPLGYEPKGRTLVINDAEAETVRTLFKLYLELGNVRRVQAEADRLGLRSKVRTKRDGSVYGGKPFGRGALYAILANPLYVGEIGHHGERYPAAHPPVVDQSTWNAAQAQLTENAIRRRSRTNAKMPSPLAGRLVDEEDRPLLPSHASKNGRRYRYYVSRDRSVGGGWRLPAAEIETLVVNAVAALLKNRSALCARLNFVEPDAADLADLITAAKALADEITRPARRQSAKHSGPPRAGWPRANRRRDRSHRAPRASRFHPLLL